MLFEFYHIHISQPEGFYHGTINLGDTVAIGIQKKESELEIQKLFYEGKLFTFV